MKRRTRVRRALASLVVAVALVAMVAAPANAGPQLHCVANGNVFVSGGPGTWTWGVNGAGTCLNFLSGNYLVSFTGSGTSTGLGLCDGLLVQNLALNMTLTTFNIRTGAVSVFNETWGAPITTFPIATPFLIGGGKSGLGVILTRVLVNCPPGGASVATFVFDTSS